MLIRSNGNFQQCTFYHTSSTISHLNQYRTLIHIHNLIFPNLGYIWIGLVILVFIILLILIASLLHSLFWFILFKFFSYLVIHKENSNEFRKKMRYLLVGCKFMCSTFWLFQIEINVVGNYFEMLGIFDYLIIFNNH